MKQRLGLVVGVGLFAAVSPAVGATRLFTLLRRTAALSACALSLVAAQPAGAATIYFNDFQGLSAAGSEWSETTISTIASQTFLGPFAQPNQWEIVTLTLTSLPVHTHLDLSFDLRIIADWDGNNASGGVGPDRFQVSILGGPTLLDTTFSNRSSGSQAFPGAYPGGSYPRYTGAAGINVLGSAVDGDSLYHLSFDFLHSGSSLVASFASRVTGSSETFALDNVSLSNPSPVPEPEVYAMLAAGLGLMGFVARRRRQQLAAA